MKIFRSIEQAAGELSASGAAITIGTFDGVHRAHARILQTLTEKARSLGVKSAVLTFSPHPRAFFAPQQGVRLLSDEREKAALIERMGVDALIVQPFSREFAALPAETFLRDLLAGKLRTRAVITGYDHSFGCEKHNAFRFLEAASGAYGIEAVLVPRMEIDGITVSSSAVRRALEGGDIRLAEKLLGRPYGFYGTVVQGKRLGRTIGYPTANIRVDSPDKLLPPDGVYAVRVTMGGESFAGMMNIGMRPTIDDYPGRSIEVNIFDFNRDIYGRTLTVEIITWVRSEIKFSSIDNLKQQLAKDAAACRALLEGGKAPF